MKRILLFFVLAGFVHSCYKISDVDIEIPTVSPRLVVVSTMVPWQSNHKYLGVTVYPSRRIADESPILPVTDARVLLFCDGVLFQELEYNADVNNQFYPMAYPPMGGPLAGETYRVEVSAPDFESVWAETSIPEIVEIVDVEIERIAYFDKNNRPVSKVNLTFNDPTNIPNYYELVLSNTGEEFTPTFFHTLHSFEPFIVSEPYYPISSIIELPVFKTLLFNDRSFDGNTTQVSFYYSPGTDIFAPQGQVRLTGGFLSVQLRNVTEEYYLHYTTLYQASRYGEVNLFEDVTQPINVYSNISGGYGVFAGFNNSVMVKELDDLNVSID